jgi:hypothetical protein
MSRSHLNANIRPLSFVRRYVENENKAVSSLQATYKLIDPSPNLNSFIRKRHRSVSSALLPNVLTKFL